MAFVADGPGFWVAGERGVGVRPADDARRCARSGRATCRARATTSRWTPSYLWVATDAGLVRFRLDAIRP